MSMSQARETKTNWAKLVGHLVYARNVDPNDDGRFGKVFKFEVVDAAPTGQFVEFRNRNGKLFTAEAATYVAVEDCGLAEEEASL